MSRPARTMNLHSFPNLETRIAFNRLEHSAIVITQTAAMAKLQMINRTCAHSPATNHQPPPSDVVDARAATRKLPTTGKFSPSPLCQNALSTPKRQFPHALVSPTGGAQVASRLLCTSRRGRRGGRASSWIRRTDETKRKEKMMFAPALMSTDPARTNQLTPACARSRRGGGFSANWWRVVDFDFSGPATTRSSPPPTTGTRSIRPTRGSEDHLALTSGRML